MYNIVYHTKGKWSLRTLTDEKRCLYDAQKLIIKL